MSIEWRAGPSGLQTVEISSNRVDLEFTLYH